MANFWHLVVNENMKIYRRLSTWIMLGIIILAPASLSALFYVAMSTPEEGANWAIMLVTSQVLYFLITIFTVVKASESVAGEFTWGTIKLLLIRPWSRGTILLSKYVATVLFALVFLAIGFMTSFLMSVLFFGYSSASPGVPGGDSPWVYMLEFYGLLFISLFTIVTFGFMMSSAFRSSGLAIGLSMFLLLSGQIIGNLFALTNKVWVKYILFLHLDLTSYLNGGYPIPGQETTLGFSIAVLAGYIILFNIISWSVFIKRDVAA